MGLATFKVPLPSEDKRWRLIEATMRRHGYQPDALIETLHTAQQSFGYLDQQALNFVARSLRVPLSKVYGVATFYHFFSLKPQGKHTCVVCLGTACYIKGSQTILDAVREAYDLEPGHTTPDNELSLLTARCVGSCSLAPVAMLDDVALPNLSVEEALDKVQEIITS